MEKPGETTQQTSTTPTKGKRGTNERPDDLFMAPISPQKASEKKGEQMSMEEENEQNLHFEDDYPDEEDDEGEVVEAMDEEDGEGAEMVEEDEEEETPAKVPPPFTLYSPLLSFFLLILQLSFSFQGMEA